MTTSTNIPHNASPTAFIVSIMSADDDLPRVCRRLAAAVNPSPMHLSRVVATGTQIYPIRLDSLRDSATLLRCEFRMRHAGRPVTTDDARGVLDRITPFQVLDARLVDERGMDLGALDEMLAAS